MNQFLGEIVQHLRTAFVMEFSGPWKGITSETAREMFTDLEVYQKLIETVMGDGEHPLARAIINASEFQEESQRSGVNIIPNKWLRVEEYRAEERGRQFLYAAGREREETKQEWRKEAVRRVMRACKNRVNISYAEVSEEINADPADPCRLRRVSIARANRNHGEEVFLVPEFYDLDENWQLYYFDCDYLNSRNA